MTYRKKFASRQDFENVIGNCQNTCVVIFLASWCNPCQVLLPHFEIFAKKYPNLSFFKVDIDEIDIRDHAYINSIPTVYVMKEGCVIDSLVGACHQRLENLIVKHHNPLNNDMEI